MRGEEILEEVRFLTNDLTYARYNEINRAYKRLCRITKFTWLRGSSESLLSFSSGTETYQLNIEGMRRLTRLFFWGTQSGDLFWNPMEEVPEQLFEVMRKQSANLDGSNRLGTPRFYKIISGPGESYELSITPSPQEDHRVRVDYIKSPVEITRDVVPEMPNAYHDVISTMSAGYVLLNKDDPKKVQRGNALVDQALSEANQLVTDSQPNRTLNIDRVVQPWIGRYDYVSGKNRYGARGYRRRW